MCEINLVQHYNVSASQEEAYGKLGDWKWWKKYCDGVITNKIISTFVSLDVSLVTSNKAKLPQMILKLVEYGHQIRI